MLNELSYKKVFIGTLIISLITIITQKVFMNVGIIKNSSLMADFISWLIIFLVTASIAMIIGHVMRNQKTIYLFLTYAVGCVIVVGAVFTIAFTYKANKTNNYQDVLTMMEEKQNPEVISLLDN